jgi:hypothetical protein
MLHAARKEPIFFLGRQLGHTACLDAVEKISIFCYCRESNLQSRYSLSYYVSGRYYYVHQIYVRWVVHVDRLCGLVVRVPVHRSRGPGFDFCSYQIF